MLNFKSVKTRLIFYLLFFAVFLAVKDKNFIFLFATLIAVISALTVEAIVLYLRTKVFQITESAIITGLIIGFVLSSNEAWWKIVFIAAIAVLSKYFIRFQKKHIFNPAAFGLFLTIVFLGVSTQWKGTYLWYILLPFGFYFAQKAKKVEIIVGYTLISLLLFGIQAGLHKVPLWNIFGYFNYFYIFIMVIEPKTTPVRALGKYLFGACTAALIFVLTEIGAKFDVELFSLLAMNAFVPLLNKIPLKSPLANINN
ncbi:MAG: RnfABCDGE type electron transport complex subunit D [Candidatus Omnitrophica bacterium]|nr:RnfABCDGE type electron transport complex subunit D [Candidatus Omnitrophota bacterium]